MPTFFHYLETIGPPYHTIFFVFVLFFLFFFFCLFVKGLLKCDAYSGGCHAHSFPLMYINWKNRISLPRKIFVF